MALGSFFSVPICRESDFVEFFEGNWDGDRLGDVQGPELTVPEVENSTGSQWDAGSSILKLKIAFGGPLNGFRRPPWLQEASGIEKLRNRGQFDCGGCDRREKFKIGVRTAVGA